MFDNSLSDVICNCKLGIITHLIILNTMQSNNCTYLNKTEYKVRLADNESNIDCTRNVYSSPPSGQNTVCDIPRYRTSGRNATSPRLAPPGASLLDSGPAQVEAAEMLLIRSCVVGQRPATFQ